MACMPTMRARNASPAGVSEPNVMSSNGAWAVSADEARSRSKDSKRQTVQRQFSPVIPDLFWRQEGNDGRKPIVHTTTVIIEDRLSAQLPEGSEASPRVSGLLNRKILEPRE